MIGTSGNVLASGSVDLTPRPLALSHFATAGNGSKAVLHVHSGSTTPTTLTSVLLDGTVSVPIFPASGLEIPPHGHAVFAVELPANQTKATGDVWTVRLEANGVSSGWGGRIIPERFPIEAWPESSDCPLPPGNASNAAEIKALGIDSVFYSSGSWNSKCSPTYSDVLGNLTTAPGNWHVFLDGEGDGERSFNAGLPKSVRAAVVDAVLIGDEVDSGINAKALRSKLDESLKCVAATPDLATYQGSATNALVGAFAGITDIQGSDAYAAACAPTQLAALKDLPLTYPYAYLRNARDNTIPLPMWGYAQLFNGDKVLAPGPDAGAAGSGGRGPRGVAGDAPPTLGWSYQPNNNEIVAQIAQTVLSGSKALMLFQSEHVILSQVDASPIAQAIASIRTVREALRVGDIAAVGITASSQDVLVETVLTPSTLVLVVLNVKASGYSNLLCHVDVGKHWSFSAQTVGSLSLNLGTAPQMANVTNWREAVGDKLVPLGRASVAGTAGTITFTNVELDDVQVARYFVADVAFKG